MEPKSTSTRDVTHHAIGGLPLVVKIIPKLEYFDRTSIVEQGLGPTVEFDVKEVTHNELVSDLRQFEITFGFSTIEMFRKYLNEESFDDEMDDWLNTFILYLGTDEVKRYSCP